MAARKFTDEQCKEICSNYEHESQTVSDLAKKYSCSHTAIRNAIKSAGGELKKNLRLTQTQCAEIRYKHETQKVSKKELAEEYGKSVHTIHKAITRAGGKWSVVKFTDEQCKEIWERYQSEKLSAKKLAEIYNASDATIFNAIKRAGGDTRGPADTQRKFSKAVSQEIRHKYEKDKRGLVDLAKEYQASQAAIAGAIRRTGGKIRNKQEARKLIFSDKEVLELLQRMNKENKNVCELARELGVSSTLLYESIKRVKGKSVWAKTLDQKAERIKSELQQIIDSLGKHIDDLPQKSWLAILRQSKVLKNIGNTSALAPVKIQLLKGEIKPEDILPPAPEPDAPVDAPPPVSKLQEEIDRVIAAHRGEEVEPETVEPITPDQPIDVIDEDDETKARLANLRPAQRLGVVAAASNATSDEQTLQSICHAQCEALWEQVFRADKNNPVEALQLVAEVQQQPATDKWTEYTKNRFLTDWRLVQECGQIPGLLMPDGWRLNLMQRREAALLLRDRARLNISGMGAGKTLSAIAGMQIIGAQRVLVLCPNATIESSWQAALATHLPSTTTATRTWQPEFEGTQKPHWVLNHHELLSDLKATELAAFLWFFEPDAVIIDEVHLCKCRNEATESQRYRNLTTLTDWARKNNAAIYGLSGTPVVNELSEPISLLRLVRPDIAKTLDQRLSGDNCMAIHEALQPISSRYVPEQAAKLIRRTIEVRADDWLDYALDASEKNGIAVDAALAPAKTSTLIELASKPGKLLVFTSAVAGVVDEARSALERVGINAVVHTGSEKGEGNNGNVQQFIHDPDVKVLLASTSTLATGFDGLQKVCRRIAFLTLPWTDAEQAQAEARILRQGVTASSVEVTTICAVLTDPNTGNDWSLDQQKLERLNSKRTISAAVCDGVIPDENALRGGLQMVERAHRKWARNVRKRMEANQTTGK